MLYSLLLGFFWAIVFAWRWRKIKARTPDLGTSRDAPTRNPSVAQDGGHTSPNIEDGSRGDANVLFRTHSPGSPPISSLVVFGDGQRIATFRRGENKLQVWSRKLVEETDLPEIKHSNGVISAMAASKDGRYIISGDDHGNVMIWNTTTRPGWDVRTVTAQARITALDVSPDSWRVASGDEDGAVAVWNVKNGKRLVGPLKDQDSQVSSVKFSPVGCHIASAYHLAGGDTHSVRIWHTRTGVQLKSIQISSNLSSQSLAWSADNRRLFIGGLYGSINCFDVETGLITHEFRAHSGDPITTLYLSRNGRLLFSVSSGHAGGIDIWDIRDVCASKLFHSHREAHIEGISVDDACLFSVGKESEIKVRSLSTIIDEARIFNRLHPTTKRLEPLTYTSNATYEAWKNGRLMEAEEALSKEIEDSRYQDYIHHLRANRALVRVRQENWTAALEDASAIMQSDGQVPLIASIAKALALKGKSDFDSAIGTFESALRTCDLEVRYFVECVKCIAFIDLERPVLMCGEADMPNDSSGAILHRLVIARKHFLLARGHAFERNQEAALRSLQKIPDLYPPLHAPEVTTISLIFGWSLRRLIIDIHELRCLALFESHYSPGSLGYFSKEGESLDEELGIITAELSSISEMFGDEARYDQRYNEAIAWYNEALALSGYHSDIVNRDVAIPHAERNIVPNSGDDNPTTLCRARLSRCAQCVAHLLSKRSEAEASIGSKESCERALPYAIQAIEMDSSFYSGYHSKYMALLGMKRYKEAFGPLQDMFSKSCRNPEINDLLKNYSQTCQNIDQVIKEIFDASPFLLIDVRDGRLCDQEERRRRFKDHESFYELVTSVSAKSKPGNIKDVVKSYFLYVMFSHTWEGIEPLFADVSGKIIYDLEYEKLRRFCQTVRDDPKGYRWAWNDTCCINKEDKDLLEKSLRSMYKWYANSALTLVLLANPSKSEPPDSPDLEHNRWMFRAWTLQELLAPEVIRFYNYSWKLYRNDTSDNHKTSPEITRELARATGVKEEALIHFSLEKLPVRRRLCLASKRKATVGVDIAYALIGILNSDIHVDYTCEADIALARLLRGCVNSLAAVTIFDWVGESSAFNSCIPNDISVYSQNPYTPPAIMDLDRRTKALQHTLPEQELGRFRQQFATRASPLFADRRLLLSCITFSIDGIQHVQGTTYNVSTTALGEFQLQTEEPFDVLRRGRRVLAFPWIPDLLTEIRRLKGEEVVIDPLWLIPYLEREFRALLFTEQSHGQYKRIAADREIVVPAHSLTSLEGVGIETLEVWEHL